MEEGRHEKTVEDAKDDVYKPAVHQDVKPKALPSVAYPTTRAFKGSNRVRKFKLISLVHDESSSQDFSTTEDIHLQMKASHNEADGPVDAFGDSWAGHEKADLLV